MTHKPAMKHSAASIATSADLDPDDRLGIELSHAIMRVLSQHSRVGQARADRVSRAASRYILKALKEAGKSSVPF